MAGFYYRGQLNGADNPVTIQRIIKNSETVTIGDAVKNSAGYVAVCDANDTPVLGIIVGIVNDKGIDLDSAPASTYDGTWTSGTVGVGTYVATDDNVTDKKIRVIVNVDPYSLWLNDANGDLTEAEVFSFFSLTDEDQIDAATNSATVGEFQLMERDPEGEPADADVSKGLFRISCSGLHSFEPEL